MAFRRCHREDGFTRLVRVTYGCNVLGVPRTGVAPLEVLAVRNRRVQTRGGLASMLGLDKSTKLADLRTAAATSLSGSRSASLDLGLGLSLTSTFLAALGVPAPGVEADLALWKGTSELAFEVRDVTQHDIDVAALGMRLVGTKIARSPAADVFFENPDVRMLVINRTLTSRQFAIRTIGSGGQSAAVSVDAIADLIGKTSATVTWHRESDSVVSFQGDEELTFAFAAVPCVMHSDRSFYFGLEGDERVLGEGGQVAREGLPIVNEDGLLVLEDL